MKAKLLVMLLAILGTFIVVPAQALTALPLDPRAGRCEKDPKVPAAWKKYQDFTWNYPACTNVCSLGEDSSTNTQEQRKK